MEEQGEALLLALRRFSTTPAPARLVFYCRFQQTEPLVHGSVTLHRDGNYSLELTGMSSAEALAALANARISRTVLLKNAWISAPPAQDRLISWDELIKVLSAAHATPDLRALVVARSESADTEPDWPALAQQQLLKVFGSYYGSAAAQKVDALVRQFARSADAQPLLDAAEHILASVVGVDRARSDLAAVRQQLRLPN